jgi:hypothetical protein
MAVTTVPVSTTTRPKTFGVRLAFTLAGVLVGIAGTLLVTYDYTSDRPAATHAAPSAGNQSGVSGTRLSADAAEHWAIVELGVTPAFTSADAAEHNAAAEQTTRSNLCTSAPTSADAAERCISR